MVKNMFEDKLPGLAIKIARKKMIEAIGLQRCPRCQYHYEYLGSMKNIGDFGNLEGQEE